MQLARLWWKKLADLWAANTGPPAPGLATNKVSLFTNAIVPTLDSAIGDFTIATYTGYSDLTMGAALPASAYDVSNGQLRLMFQDPVGGWAFPGPTDPTQLPVTIYGFIITDAGGTNLFASQLLNTPIVFTELGQELDIGEIALFFSTGSPF